MQNLDAVKTKWLEAVAVAGSPAALEDVRVKALGKSGEVSALMKGLGAMSPDERREARRQPLAVVEPAGSRGYWVARADALPEQWRPAPDRLVWTAGGRTWRRLAERGVWVHGCADGLGDLRPTRLVVGSTPPQAWRRGS